MSKISLNDKLEILKKTDLFEGFTDLVLKSIADIVEVVSIKEGLTFIKKGEQGDCMYILFEGKVKIHDDDAKIAEIEPIGLIGEMAILMTDQRTASVTTLENSILLKITRNEFEVLAEDNVDFYKSMVKLLIKKLQKQNNELIDFARNARRIMSLF